MIKIILSVVILSLPALSFADDVSLQSAALQTHTNAAGQIIEITDTIVACSGGGNGAHFRTIGWGSQSISISDPVTGTAIANAVCDFSKTWNKLPTTNEKSGAWCVVVTSTIDCIAK